jgi:4-amino-4-deoxy-L-arabinose transferase-like glycosyltransferase
MLAALLVAAVFGLPGLAVLAAARARGARSWPWPRGLAVSLAVGVTVAAIAAIVLGAVGVYSFGSECAALAALVAGCIVAAERRLAWPLARATRVESVGVVIVAALAASLFVGRPSEMLLGERDATVYTVSGIGLARQGSLVLRDLAADRIGTEAMRRFYPGGTGGHDTWLLWPQFVKYPGFYYADADRRLIVTQGFAFLPAIIAIFYGAFGVAGALAANNWLAIVAVLAVFAAGVELVGETAATIGAIVLVLGGAEVWAARYPVAEIAMQMLLFAGLAAFLRGDRLGRALAGLLIGAMFLAKIEAALVLPPVVAFAAVSCVRRRDVVTRSFWGGFAATVIAALAYWVAFTPDYVRTASRTFSSFLRRTAVRYDRPGAWTMLLVVAVVLAVTAVLVARARTQRGLTTAVSRAVAFAIVAFVGFGYTLRPYFPGMVVGQPMTVVWLGWYLTPPVLLLGFAGLAHHFYTRPRADHLFVLGIVLTMAAVFLHFTYVNLIHPYLTRRFVPAAVPLVCVFFGHAIAWIGGRGEGRSGHVASAIAVVLVAGTIASLIARGRPFYRNREYPGLERELATLAESMRGADLVLLSDRPVRNLLGATLEFVYGLPTVIAWPGSYTVHADLIRRWLEEEKRITVLTSRTELESVPGADAFDRVRQQIIPLQALRQVADRFPSEVDVDSIALTQYAAGPGSNPLYDFWKRSGAATLERVCGAGTRLLDGDPFLVRRVRAHCPAVAASGRNVGVLVGAVAAPEWEQALALYGARFVRHDLAGVVLLDGLAPQPQASRLSPDDWTLEASDGRGTEREAVDGSMQTRWRSRAPQRPGMTFSIGFAEPTDVRWVKIRMGHLRLDRARALSFETSSDGSRWERRDVPAVLDGLRWEGEEPVENSNGDVDLWVNADGIRFLRLENRGESSHFDWSIVEVEIDGQRAP